MRRVGFVLLAMFAGCGAAGDRGSPPGAGWTTFHDPRNGLSVRFPSSWHRARVSLTPDLVDPRELLSLGSFPLSARPRGRCAQFPAPAMLRAGPRDVFLTIQERSGPASGDYPARRRPFALGRAGESEAEACGASARAWHSYWIAFRDAGRPFYALVLIGVRAPATRVRELRAVLDSLRFDRSTRFEAGPGVSGRLPPGWRLIDRRLAVAVPSDRQIAAATFTVPPGPPERNCTPAAALHRIGSRDALVYGFAYDEGTSLRDFPRRPAHFRLDPRALQPYECMGRSYLIRWREHGRGLQAHVYFGDRAGAARRREALQFLDDLVIEE